MTDVQRNDPAPAVTSTARVAVVGYGLAGREFHAPLLAAAGAPAAMVVTRDPDRRAQAARDVPGVLVVDTLAEVLSRGVDLVVLATPTGAHVEGALACIQAGVPVVVDKPIAVSADEAQRVVDAAAVAQVPITVFQNRRWDPENRTLATLLTAQGPLGNVHRFERRWERWRPVPKSRWRENSPAEQGGGLLLDLGSHLVDSAVQFFGPVAQVYAESRAWTTPSEDDVFLSLEHVSGVRSHLSATTVAAAPGPRTRVLGEHAAYVATQFEEEPFVFGFPDAPGNTGYLVVGTESAPVPTAPGSVVDFYRQVLSALQEPADLRQAAMPVDPRDAVAVMRVLDAARDSAAQGRVVTL